MWADFGLGGPSKPIWLRDNPFLLKTSRAEARKPGLSLRLAVAVVVLGGLLLGGMSLTSKSGTGLSFFLGILFQTSLFRALFAATAFIHVLLIVSARTSGATVLAEEARRVTLPDLLMTPLRRAEMLLAMGVGPARAALLVALAGLPVYALLGQFGGLTAWETVCLYLLFALLCYQPPAYAVPALSGLGQTPDAAPGQFAAMPNKRGMRRAGLMGAGFPTVLSFLFLGQALGAIGGGWLAHFFSALHLPLLSGFSFLLFFTWPYYGTLLLSDRLPFFHSHLSPLFYVLPLALMQWAGSALSSASALSAGSLDEMRRLPLWTRAQTLSRWTARLMGFCALAVVWRAWVESGDTAGLAGLFAAGPGWNAAGLLTLLGGASLPNVYSRALAVAPQAKPAQEFRPAALVLRRALKRSLRPLGVALLMFLIVCVLGRLSPFAAPVYLIAAKIAAAGVSAVFWAVGVRRAAPKIGIWGSGALVYALPFGALSVPGGSIFAAFSPASAWVRLFAGGPGLVSRFPWWHLGTLPSFWVCAAGPLLVGMALMTVFGRQKQKLQTAEVVTVPVRRMPSRNERQTAALMTWIGQRTDNPLFTYELRARTRSGRWFDQLILGFIGFAAAIALSLSYPLFVDGFAQMSPFKFFSNAVSIGTGSNAGVASAVRSGVLLELASILLAAQCVVLGLRGQAIGERLIAKDREQGTWGFLLISPLTVRQIFWGKVFGQTASVGAAWVAASVACFVLYGVSVPLVGLGPALAVWASGQIFVAALFVLGVGLGTALTTFPLMQKTLKGLSTLLFVFILGGSAYIESQYLLDSYPSNWWMWAMLLGVNSLYVMGLVWGLFWLAERRLSILRGRDVAAGDGMG